MSSTAISLTQLVQDSVLILLDIEGATTSISFVKDELFPFARAHALNYLKETWSQEETQDSITSLVVQITDDVRNNVNAAKVLPPFPEQEDDRDPFLEALFENIKAMMDADRKISPLKKLQGQIWRQGYFDGQLKGHLYEDAFEAMRKWKEDRKQIYIYSSGSVEAQKLLFKYSEFGDLLHLINGHFDTKIGSKIETESYVKIAKEVNLPPEKITFITDIPKEARAAQKAAINVILSRRPGTAPLLEEDLNTFPIIDSFDELFDQRTKSIKRKREDGREA